MQLTLFARGFAAGVAGNLIITERFALRDAEGNMLTNPQDRQTLPAAVACIVIAGALRKGDMGVLGLGVGILSAVLMRHATGCYDLTNGCSPR